MDHNFTQEELQQFLDGHHDYVPVGLFLSVVASHLRAITPIPVVYHEHEPTAADGDLKAQARAAGWTA